MDVATDAFLEYYIKVADGWIEKNKTEFDIFIKKIISNNNSELYKIEEPIPLLESDNKECEQIDELELDNKDYEQAEELELDTNCYQDEQYTVNQNIL